MIVRWRDSRSFIYTTLAVIAIVFVGGAVYHNFSFEGGSLATIQHSPNLGEDDETKGNKKGDGNEEEDEVEVKGDANCFDSGDSSDSSVKLTSPRDSDEEDDHDIDIDFGDLGRETEITDEEVKTWRAYLWGGWRGK